MTQRRPAPPSAGSRPCVTPWDHAENLAYIHERTGIPVASGERMYSRWQFKECLERDAVQVIQPDLGTCEGITEVKKI